MFCNYCGAPNPGGAAFCRNCGKAIAARSEQPATPLAQQPQAPAEPPRSVEPSSAVPVHVAPHSIPIPPRRGSHVPLYLALAAVLIAAVIVIAISLAVPRPQVSLQKAGTALINGDSQTFDSYVDVQSILGDWTDQAASSALGTDESAGSGLVTNSLVAGFKSFLLPKLASSVEQEILGHPVSSNPQSGGTDSTANYMSRFLSNGVRTLITSNLKYQGVAAQNKSGTEAVLDVRFSTDLGTPPFIVQVRMQRTGDHWRIIAIPNVAELLARLRPAANASPQSSQADLQYSATPAGKVEKAPPQSPAAVPPPPAATTTAQPDDDPIGPGGFITPPSQ